MNPGRSILSVPAKGRALWWHKWLGKKVYVAGRNSRWDCLCRCWGLGPVLTRTSHLPVSSFTAHVQSVNSCTCVEWDHPRQRPDRINNNIRTEQGARIRGLMPCVIRIWWSCFCAVCLSTTEGQSVQDQQAAWWLEGGEPRETSLSQTQGRYILNKKNLMSIYQQ